MVGTIRDARWGLQGPSCSSPVPSLQVGRTFCGFLVPDRMLGTCTDYSLLLRSGGTGNRRLPGPPPPPAATRRHWSRMVSPVCHPQTSNPIAPLPHQQPASPTPIFGASSTFGGTGFGGFSGVAAKAAGGNEGAAEEGGEEEAAAEEECQAEFKPVVQLDEVEVSTGEEDEEALFDA